MGNTFSKSLYLLVTIFMMIVSCMIVSSLFLLCYLFDKRIIILPLQIEGMIVAIYTVVVIVVTLLFYQSIRNRFILQSLKRKK